MLSIYHTASAQSSVAYHFASISSEVVISSPTLAHVTRSVLLVVDSGNLTHLDWGIWYPGSHVTVTRVADANGNLGFIYPTPDSDPEQPKLEILFARAISSGDKYGFSYEFDVTSSQSQSGWSETFDVASVRVESLSVSIQLPAGYTITGLQPTNAKVSQQGDKMTVDWTGTNLTGQSDAGLKIGFSTSANATLQQTDFLSVLSGFLPYIGVVASLAGLTFYGARKFSKRNRRIEPEVILESKAQEASLKLKQDAVQTGLPSLDYLLNGGLPSKTASLLTAPVCDERDIIIRRFVETGAKSGYSVYVGKDTSKVKDLLGSNPSSFKALIVGGSEPRSEQANVRVTTRLENLTAVNIDLMPLLQDSPKPAESKRILLDVLDDILLLHKAITTRKWLSQLIQRAEGLGFTLLATLNSQMHSQGDVQAMVDLFEGHIEMIEREIEAKPMRAIRVRKMFRWKFLDTEALLDRDRLS